MSPTSLWNKNFSLTFISIIFIFTNFYALTACMPMAIHQLKTVSAKEMSLLASIYFFGIVVMRPFSGMIGNKYGKKRVSFIMFIAFSLCSIAYLGIDSLYIILAVRFFHGISHSLSTTPHAAMAIDFSPEGMKGRGIGYYGLAMLLAMVIAPAMGIYILDNFGYQSLLIVVSIMSIIGTLITIFISSDREKKPTKNNITFSWKNLIETKALPIGASVFLLSIAYSGIMSFIALYLKDLNITNGSIYFYLAFALVMISTRPFVGKIIDQKGAHHLVYLSLTLFTLGMVFLAYADGLPSVLLSGIILGLAYGAIFPCLQTITVQSCPPENSSTAMGTFYLFYDLGLGLGSLFLAYLSNIFGFSYMYIGIAGLTILIIMVYKIFKTKKYY